MTSPLENRNKRRKLDFSEITVVVGMEEARFTVHRSFIRSSKVLEKSCGTGWFEPGTKLIHLPEVESETFIVYRQWLYTNEVMAEDDEGDDVYRLDVHTKLGCESADWYFALLCRLAILGHQLDDASFRNKVNDTALSVAKHLDFMPHPSIWTSECNDLPKSSLFRKLLIDMYATIPQPKLVKELGYAAIPAEFAFEVMLALLDDRNVEKKRERPLPVNRCNYHEHCEDEPKCATISDDNKSQQVS